jgi:Protein of unknown function (DUF3370)
VIKHSIQLYLPLSLVSLLLIPISAKLTAQTSSPPALPQVLIKPQAVRPLPGSLDSILTFNSNSPEVVQTEGILLSTFPPQGKAVPSAHLNFPLQGRFDLFAHHIAKAATPTDLRTLYLGIILYNPGQQAVTVNILQAASYLSQPDAPFIPLPALQENLEGKIFAGPGDRVVNDILRRHRQPGWPAQITLPARESRMLLNLPIPVKSLIPPLNGRSALMRVKTNRPVYAASLGMFAPTTPEGAERAPTLQEWQNMLQTAGLSGPRDKVPTPPDAPGKLIYGRVAGIAKGSRWVAQISDSVQDGDKLQIPVPGAAFSYVLSSVVRGTLGTKQVQSAPMLARYPDTAYQAHGNYGIEYELKLPLYNASNQSQQVTLALQTPLKTEDTEAGLRFNQPPPNRVFFRGTVRLRYRDDQNSPQTRYMHLVQKQGEEGSPLLTLSLKPQETRLVEVNLIYPPDATPPQVLTVQTLPSPKK